MNIDYITGFFDGEVCFTISTWGDEKALAAGRFPINVSPRVTVTQSDVYPNVLEIIKRFLGMGHVYYHTRSKPAKNGSKKGEINFRIYRKEDQKKLIKLLENKMIVKKRELSLFNETLDLMKNKKENIRKIFQIANELNPRRVNPRKWTMEKLEEVLRRYEQKLREKERTKF